MNSQDQAKMDSGNPGQLAEPKAAPSKLDSTNRQQAKKPNVKQQDSDKNDETNASEMNINEKFTSAKQSSAANPKGAAKSGPLKTTSAKNSSLEPTVTPTAPTSTTPASQAATAAKSLKLANSDSGIDSTGTDVSPSTVKDLSNHPTTSNTPNKRSAINHQVTNRSMSESLTSTDGIRTPDSENLSKTNLYIRGLPSSTTDEDLYNMCAKYGTISSTKAIFDKNTGCCRGYGFVRYTMPQSAEVAVVELNKSGTSAQMARLPSFHSSHNQHYAHQHHFQNHHHQTNQHTNHYNNSNSGGNNNNNINNNNINTNNNSSTNNNNDHQPHYNRSNGSGNMNANNSMHVQDNNGNHHNNNHADPTNLYIANLPLDMSEDDLLTLLSSYGPVISTRILRDERNMTRGVGFARMETRDKCQEVIEKLNGKPCKGSDELLLVKFADGGNRKRHHNQNNHHSSHHHQHHQKYQNHEDHRWREESHSNSDPSNVSTFEQHGNIPHNNQMPDLSMMNPMGYRMPQPYPPNMNPAAGYPVPPGGQARGLQWIHPGQAWNVIPQQMMPPTGLAAPNQAGAAPAAYTYAHLPQLTSQMQGLQIAHHPGAHMGGYLPAHPQQWQVWTPHIPHQQPSMRLGGPQQNPVGPQQQPAVGQSSSESTQASYTGGQDAPQDAQQKQSANVGERVKQVQVPAPI